ncbi:hypothetical protein PUMCH_001546 [Australozyma saopauloensis]|uniref:Bud emergence protein 1 n=1 Tax=Australozyma saopauloensis TaxID=291208 RepID=A0AAX4H7P2_9ASCO|nr:hypothetical protein PUMCH_001546 [[Candida] saopauloensis]
MIKSFRKSKRLSNSLGLSKHLISRVTSGQLTAADLHQVHETPLKVIKALYDYEPQGPGELRFKCGDFFHVLQEEGASGHEANGWYEATNPVTQQRGMVPISYFEAFSRTRQSQKNDNVIDQGNPINSKLPGGRGLGSKQLNQALYAVAMFDFKAERSDELDLKNGESLIICAHHDYEWFIAKPITRLGGPGLVPVLYVKIIDMAGSTGLNNVSPDDTVGIINLFQVPTVEQWKVQTARYQALSIPLGQISQSEPSLTANSQFFNRDGPGSNRLSLSSSRTYLLEAGVDSYQLEHGRYQYSVVARLSNGKTRHLYRYYQDFYDLQVKLLEMFPVEAGKMENSRRIIPSIPGPLINVNDSISKLRREKLDLYLRGLISLPAHISRSDDVLALFDVLENGYDREVDTRGDRTSKPVMQKSNYQQDRLSQYSNLQSHMQRNSLTPSLDSPIQRSRSSLSTNVLNNLSANNTSMNTSHQSAMGGGSGEKSSKIKVKFYYEDDIFVLLLPANLRLADLRTKLARRLDIDAGELGVHLFIKRDYDEFMDLNGINTDSLTSDQRERLFQLVVDDDMKFQQILVDKSKVVILTD